MLGDAEKFHGGCGDLLGKHSKLPLALCTGELCIMEVGFELVELPSCVFQLCLLLRSLRRLFEYSFLQYRFLWKR
jgi:hypothetical protein